MVSIHFGRFALVSIFVQNSIEYFVQTDLSNLNAHIETIFIEIDKEQIGKDKNVIVGVIYRPPDTDDQNIQWVCIRAVRQD